MRKYYSDHPDLVGLPTVITVNGEREYRINCRRIQGKDTNSPPKYYIIDKDVFFIGKVWYRVEGGKIEKDWETGKYVLKDNSNLITGVVSIDKNNLVLGKFSPNKYNNCRVKTPSGILPCISADMLSNNGYKEVSHNGEIFFEKNNIAEKYPISNSGDYRSGFYNIDDDLHLFNTLKEEYGEFKGLKISAGHLKVAKSIGNLTFGCELEAIKGFLPPYIRSRYGVYICRDGSLHSADGSQGPEYVTVPYYGAKGVAALCNVADEVSKRNEIDINCSFHIHFGNIRTDRVFIVALYKLGCQIQNEIFKMFPYYKINEIKFAGKQKNYCKKLKSFMEDYSGNTKEDFSRYIDNNYIQLFQFLLGGSGVPSVDINRRSRVHPQRNKWERSSRYYWLNFMNLFFSDRNTIEVRLHTATSNKQKIISWLLISAQLIQYADKHTESILRGGRVTLNKILRSMPDEEIKNYLSSYISFRKTTFSDEFDKNDFTGASSGEFTKDKEFVFNHNFLKYLK